MLTRTLKRNSIIYKYGAVYLASSALVSSLIVAHVFLTERREIYQAALRSNQSIARGISLSIENPLRTSDVRAVAEVVGIYMNLELSYAKVLDSQGVVLLERGELPDGITPREAEVSGMTLQIGDADQPLGIMKLVFSLAKLQDQVARLRARLLMLGVAMFVSLSVFTLLVFMLLARKIRRLDSWVLEITEKLPGRGAPAAAPSPAARPGADELDRLRANFDNLLGELGASRERELRNSKFATIGQTAALLAHDVRKPFSMLKMLLSTLDALKSNPSELGRAKADVSRSITHVESMIADIMDFSREIRLERKPCALAPILDFSIRQAAQGHGPVDVTLRYEGGSARKPLVDEERVSRVFSNLFSNAIEAITVLGKKSSGEIVVSLRDLDGMVEITVGNDGPPILEEDLPRLFESFFTKGKTKGTGLGLSSARKIVDLHGGEISARNRPGGAGAEFVVRLPASAERGAADLSALPRNVADILAQQRRREDLVMDSALAQLDRSGAGGIKVLILEDEPLYRAAVRNTIRKSEELHRMLTLYEAKTVSDALQLIETEDIRYAIVDIDLGEERNGFDFLAELKAGFPQVSAMVHSNRTLKEDFEKAAALGAKSFVPKPLAVENLVSFLLASAPRGGGAGRKTVFACDDDALARRCMGISLAAALKGAEIHVFPSGEELLAEFRERTAAGAAGEVMVFTDQNMKGMSGLELTAALRALDVPCRIYVVSNEPRAELAPRALKAGADAYYEGPLDAELLAKILPKEAAGDADKAG